MNVKKLIFLTACFSTTNVLANQHYIAPPTSSTHGHVPVISDEMEHAHALKSTTKRNG